MIVVFHFLSPNGAAILPQSKRSPPGGGSKRIRNGFRVAPGVRQSRQTYFFVCNKICLLISIPARSEDSRWIPRCGIRLPPGPPSRRRRSPARRRRTCAFAARSRSASRTIIVPPAPGCRAWPADRSLRREAECEACAQPRAGSGSRASPPSRNWEIAGGLPRAATNLEHRKFSVLLAAGIRDQLKPCVEKACLLGAVQKNEQFGSQAHALGGAADQ